MSLVPYLPDTPMEPIGFATPFLMGVMLMATAFASAEPNDDDDLSVETTPAQLEEPPVKDAGVQTPPPQKAKCPEEDPLDAEILRLLLGCPEPMTVKELSHLIPGSQKRAINSRLYKMLSQKKISQWKTEGAPIWFA